MTSRHSSVTSSTLALSTEHSRPPRRRAVSKATRPMRSISDSRYTRVLKPSRSPLSSVRTPRGSPK